ncbi:MAG TPA: acyl-CoA dehydrogenase family protein [Burkholderiaceae bacterium]|nr:acyl-CoA dehydrogenase family protein [Burkholderiaceae bacterium]
MSPADDTLAMLRDSLARYLADHHDVEARRALLADPRRGAPLWRGLARDLGLLGASFPESLGGFGGTLADALSLLETLGERLAAEPYLSTVAIAGDALARAGGERAREAIGAIVDGRAVIAFAHDEPHRPADARALRSTLARRGAGFVLAGRKSVVTCAPWATHLLVSAGDGAGGTSLALVDADAPGIVRRDVRTLDGGWASELRFDDVAVPAAHLVGEPGEALEPLERALDVGALAVCFESLGTMRRLMADTIAHANQRRQFGVPIASFQALQHRIVDMHLAFEQARALTRAAAASIDAAPASRAAAVSSAKVIASRACRVVGQGAVQVHGGMGMTDELALGHYFRRATAIELEFGTVARHLRRIDRLAG